MTFSCGVAEDVMLFLLRQEIGGKKWMKLDNRQIIQL